MENLEVEYTVHTLGPGLGPLQASLPFHLDPSGSPCQRRPLSHWWLGGTSEVTVNSWLWAVVSC